ncbi:MAG: pilin [Candidatus Moraniibacteriota bacterium]
MPASPGCGNLTQYGSCGSNQQGGSVCCIPKDCSPTTTPTANTSGSTSLNYTPLENLPGFDGQSGDFATYFGNLYKLALWIVGISALFMLVVGGFLYLSSAGNTSLLGTAKKYIYSALIGLVIALISWLLLDTINGDLTNLKLSGLNGAIGTAGAPGTTGSPSAGTGPGGSTTTGTYTHAEAVAALSAAGIGVKSSTGCLGKDAAGCTTLEQIPKSAIDNLIAIKKDCGCSFDVTGGTETAGHVSHGPGKPIVDVTQDTTLGNFLYSKAGGSGGATITKSPGYGIGKICVTTAWEKLNYGCGNYREKEAHFHLVF